MSQELTEADKNAFEVYADLCSLLPDQRRAVLQSLRFAYNRGYARGYTKATDVADACRKLSLPSGGQKL